MKKCKDNKPNIVKKICVYKHELHIDQDILKTNKNDYKRQLNKLIQDFRIIPY